MSSKKSSKGAPSSEEKPTVAAASAGDGGADMALFLACEDGDIKKVRRALKQGANVDFQDAAKKNRTPLMEACKVLNGEIIKLLVTNGCDVNLQDADGWNCLHWIAFKGHAKIMIYLLEKGANFMKKSNSGSTPYDVCVSLTSQKKTQCEFVLRQWMDKLPKKKKKQGPAPSGKSGEGNWGYSYHVPRNSTGRCSLDRTTGWDDTWQEDDDAKKDFAQKTMKASKKAL